MEDSIGKKLHNSRRSLITDIDDDFWNKQKKIILHNFRIIR